MPNSREQVEVRSPRRQVSAAQQERLLDQLDQPLQGGGRGVEVPGARVGVLEHDGAAGPREADVRLHLLVAAPEGADLVAGVHEVERVRLELAGEEIVLDQADVPQALLGHEPVGGGEHRLVDVGPGHLPVGSHPLAQDPQPPEHAATDIQRAGAAAVADLLEQPPAAGLPDPRLELEPLELRGLPGQQVPGQRLRCHCSWRSAFCSSPRSTIAVEYRRAGSRWSSPDRANLAHGLSRPCGHAAAVLQQVQPVRLRHRRGPRGATQPGVGVLKVAVDGVLAEHEPRRDLAVRESLRDEAQDLELAAE